MIEASVIYGSHLPPSLSTVLDQEGIQFKQVIEKPGVEAKVYIELYNLKGLIGSIDNSHVNSVITSHDQLAELLSLVVKTSKSESFSAPGVETFFSSRVQAIDAQNLVSFEQIGVHRDKSGKAIAGTGILFGWVKNVYIVSLPWTFSGCRQMRRSQSGFLSRSDEFGGEFTELSPKVDWKLVRSVIEVSLRCAFYFAGKPYRKRELGTKGRRILAVRLDADGFHEESARNVHDVSKRLEIPFSWFLDVSAWLGKMSLAREISEKSEIGIHCFHHITFHWFGSNFRNLARARKVLESNGMRVHGVVSPFGLWNRAYSRAVDKLKMSYTSEFSNSGDVLPFFQSKNRIMHLPPITSSIGVWRASSSYWEYLDKVVESRLKECGFAIVYDHPTDINKKDLPGFEAFLQSQKAKGTEFVTMKELFEILRQTISDDVARENLPMGSMNRKSTNWDFVTEIQFTFSSAREAYETVLGLHNSNSKDHKWNLRKDLFFRSLGILPLEIHLTWAKLRKILFAKKELRLAA